VLHGAPTVRMHDGDRELKEGDVLGFPRGAEGGYQIGNGAPETPDQRWLEGRSGVLAPDDGSRARGCGILEEGERVAVVVSDYQPPRRTAVGLLAERKFAVAHRRRGRQAPGSPASFRPAPDPRRHRWSWSESAATRIPSRAGTCRPLGRGDAHATRRQLRSRPPPVPRTRSRPPSWDSAGPRLPGWSVRPRTDVTRRAACDDRGGRPVARVRRPPDLGPIRRERRRHIERTSSALVLRSWDLRR
jgi:hypothetical protein